MLMCKGANCRVDERMLMESLGIGEALLIKFISS
jgi:hypothetical protein